MGSLRVVRVVRVVHAAHVLVHCTRTTPPHTNHKKERKTSQVVEG